MYRITVRGSDREVKMSEIQDVGRQVANYTRLSRLLGDKAARVLFINVTDGGEPMRVESSLLLVYFYWTKDEVKVRTFADLERDLFKNLQSSDVRWDVEKRLWLALTNQQMQFLIASGVLDSNGGLKSYPMPKNRPALLAGKELEGIDDEELIYFAP
jgi:hypothetical protein